MTLALEFPPISHLINWPDIWFEGTPFAVNKTTIIYVLAVLITLAIFFTAGARAQLVPRGIQNIAESSVDFVRQGIIMQTIGPDGMRFLPFLLTMFFFILFVNLFEIIPFIQFPGNARMAVPFLLAILVWFIYNIVGIVKQGPLAYLKNSTIPPGVPWPMLILIVPIEFISTFLVRPFSLAVRLFANMLAGHLILVTFAVLSAALWAKNISLVILPFPFLLLIALTGFELLVAFLQAFIFTILTAVYIGTSIHPEH
ncbi:MAG TPA: F0F1 ATP synthase subunit A [Acidimicrobiia bacterium]|nr:F0F1 ATP synthase subunit A [Acidimicrobiia bacterium]